MTYYTAVLTKAFTISYTSKHACVRLRTHHKVLVQYTCILKLDSICLQSKGHDGPWCFRTRKLLIDKQIKNKAENVIKSNPPFHKSIDYFHDIGHHITMCVLLRTGKRRII